MSNQPTQSPGELLKKQLSDNGFTQADFAIITNLSRQTISNIITGRSNITPETAVIFANAFGNHASMWLDLDAKYRLAQVEEKKPDIQYRAKIMKSAPIRDMQRRGWISETANFSELETELKNFFNVSELGDEAGFSASFRRNTKLSYDEKAVNAWCMQSKRMAEVLPVETFREENLEILELELRKVAAFTKETFRIPKIFAKYGIRFVINEHLPQTKIDGAAFWLDDYSPVIAISVRYDRMDYFWFTIMHELKHIQHKDSLSVDNGFDEVAKSDINQESIIETRANEEAAASLIDPKELDSFINRVSPFYSQQRVIQFAHRIKIHPGIIVGQLQKRGEISYSTLRKLIPKIRSNAIETTLTDGWGKRLPATFKYKERSR